MRIHIVGGAGSGKTTLAKGLSSHLNIPYYEIDVIGWEGGHGQPRSLEERLYDIHALALQPSWVTDNNFAGWTDELLDAADVIILLDLPWHLARWRIVTRHLRASLAGTNRHKGLLKLYQFLKMAQEYYIGTNEVEGTLLADLRHLQPYDSKVVRCRKQADVEAFFLRIGAEMYICE